jgi:hypothetical protein
MPRPGPRRPLVAFRMGDEDRAAIDQRARDEGLVKADGEPNRSEMLRRLFAYAIAKMPTGWKP